MRKLFVRIIFGFSLGVTLLVFSYLGIYYVAGQEAFNSVILKLTDANVLQTHLLSIGFAGSMMGFTLYIMEQSLKKEEKSTFSLIPSIVALLLSMVLSMKLIENLAILDEATSYMFTILGTVLICAYMLLQAVRSSIDELIINKKIKEKNG